MTILSFLGCLAAFAGSLLVLYRAADRRLVPLNLLLGLLALRQGLAALGPRPGTAHGSSLLDDLLVTVAALLGLIGVAWLGRTLDRPSSASQPTSPESVGDVMARLLDASPAVIYSARPSGDYGSTYVSENITAQFGWEPRQFIEDPGFWAAHIHPDDSARVVGERVGMLERGELSQEYRFQHKDGEYRWMHDELRVVRDANDKPEMLVGSWLDITESKELEAQYRQAQRGEAVGRLAGGIAHDFNNLLNVIIGFSGLAREKLSSDDPLRRDLDLVCDAGAKATDLTRQLLAFSRQQVLQPKVLDLNEVIRGFEPLLRRTIEENIQISLDLETALGRVRADQGHLEQVLMNLAVNARDAMPQGGSLTVETSNVVLDSDYVAQHPPARAGRYVLLAVTDSGEGMDASTRARAFEPFFTTKPKGQGTGLGLSTVYGIVKQSYGFVWVYSELGHGTTFKIYLPAVEAPVAREDLAAADRPAPSGTETVLVVEDDEAVRTFAARALEDRGYRVRVARHAEEALQVCRELSGGLDLVVTDLVMPGGTGPELVEQLSEQRPGVKALFISGYTETAALNNGLLPQRMDFLGKPFRATALAAKVREALDRDGPSPQATAGDRFHPRPLEG